MNGLDLFSGIGGMSLALREWVRPVAYCEIDPYCQAVLLSRMADESLPNIPIWDDIRTLSGLSFNGAIDVIYGGFPCQDISIAGKGKGLEGERSGLFFEIMRLSKEIKPKFIFLENVPAITTRGGLDVVREITEMGYDCRWCVISAASVGALHKRERWFLLAYANNHGLFASEGRESFGECPLSGRQGEEKQAESIRKAERTSGISRDVAYDRSKGLEGFRQGEICTKQEKPESTCSSEDVSHSMHKRHDNTRTELVPKIFSEGNTVEQWQEIVSAMGKLTDGIPNRLARIKALGNSVVPQQAREAFRILSGLP